MSTTLGPEATELLTGKPPEAPVGAVPEKPGEKPLEKPAEAQTVPLAALVGEQANTRVAREAFAHARSQLEPLGYQVLDDGTVIAPRQAETLPGIDPEIQEMSDALGLDAAKLQRVIDRRIMQTGGAMLDPITRHGFEQSKREYAHDDPDYDVYAKTLEEELERRVKTLPKEYQAIARVHPDLLRDAKAAARDKHFTELVTRAADRKANPGKVVGKFVESAAPGTQEGPAAKPLSEGTLEWMRRSYTPEEIAAKEAARGGR